LVDIRRLYVLRAGFTIRDSKPSTTGEASQFGSEGCRHFIFTGGAAGEFWPIAVKWPGLRCFQNG
jgi:hypothetical protein